MAQTATLYLLDKKNLESLQSEMESEAGKKKSLLDIVKKTSTSIVKRLEKLATEKMVYRWSGMAFPILAVFSKEKLHVDWDSLEYSNIANALAKNLEAGIYIFSISDEGLLRLRPDGLFYSFHQLEEFAVEFTGNIPGNPNIMKDAVGFLSSTLTKLTRDYVVLLLIV